MISIIIPVYNCEDCIDICINSILQQSYDEFEIVLIDDGSSDKCGLICDKYAESDSRIKVLHQTNQGASVARNRGINISNGEYITFLDCDDYWLENTVLEKIAHRLKETNADVLSFNFCKVREHELGMSYFSIKKSMPITYNENQSIEFIKENDLWIACAWNKVIRRDLFSNGQLRFIEGVTAEDIAWCAKLALIADRFDYLNIVAVGYVQRSDSVSGALNIKKIQCLKDNIDDVIRCTDVAVGTKRSLLYSYLSYQIGTYLFDIASITDAEKKVALIKESKQYMRYLKYSKSKKIKCISFVNKLIGYKGLFILLNLYHKVYR